MTFTSTGQQAQLHPKRLQLGGADGRFFCCRHVILPRDVAALVPKERLMAESEWRKLGVQQSRGWVHYMTHKPGGLALAIR